MCDVDAPPLVKLEGREPVGLAGCGWGEWSMDAAGRSARPVLFHALATQRERRKRKTEAL